MYVLKEICERDLHVSKETNVRVKEICERDRGQEVDQVPHDVTWCMLLVSKETNVCIERDVFKRPSCVKRDQFIYEKRPMENTDFKR